MRFKIIPKKASYIALCVTVCLLIGGLAGLATQSAVNDWYVQLDKPGFVPPNWVFAPVWTVLYICMGVAAGLVWSHGLHHIWVKTAMYHFVFQLLLNGMWSLVFFGLKHPLAAFLVILALIVMILLTMKWFRVVDRSAAKLLWPYLIWVCFAAVLNFGILWLNRDDFLF